MSGLYTCKLVKVKDPCKTHFNFFSMHVEHDFNSPFSVLVKLSLLMAERIVNEGIKHQSIAEPMVS